MRRRAISREQVEETIRSPDAIKPGYGGRQVYQRRVELMDRQSLLRAIVEQRNDNTWVITAYRTSKLQKYGAPHESKL